MVDEYAQRAARTYDCTLTPHPHQSRHIPHPSLLTSNPFSYLSTLPPATDLLEVDPIRRLGSRVRGRRAVREHPFLAAHLDVDKLEARKLKAPWVPTSNHSAAYWNPWLLAALDSGPSLPSLCELEPWVVVAVCLLSALPLLPVRDPWLVTAFSLLCRCSLSRLLIPSQLSGRTVGSHQRQRLA